MKKLLIALAKFVLLFVPFYMALSFFVPSLEAQRLADGIPLTVLFALGKGCAAGIVLIGGTWLLDKFKRKEDKEKK